MSARIFLHISRASWNNKDPQSFHKLLLLKMMLAIGVFGILIPLYVTVFVRARLDHIFVLQILMWFVCLIAYLNVRNDKQVFKASLIIINVLSALLLSILITSRIGDISGAYHHVVPILVAASFLLGPRLALPYFLLFFGFYLAIGLGIWHDYFPGTIPALHPGRTSLYVDRMLEVTFAFGLSFMFDRMKLAQQKRIQEQEKEVAKKEKQLSINQMAGGIAHEINNPLAILLGYLELLEKHEFNKKDLERINPRIQMAAKRIQFVVWSLNQLNNQRENKSGVTPLDVAMREVEWRIRDLNADLRLTMAECKGIKVRLMVEDFQNVLYTILVNAVEALAGKMNAAIEVKYLIEGNLITIEVWDNGDDVNAGDLAKFAEPFFTTKLDRPGRGMGLTLALSTIQQVGGQLVFRRDGEWTVASLTLPGFATPVIKAS